MNVRPLHDRILVKRLEEGEQRIGGIIIPDTAKEKPQQGKVVAVGRGRINDKGKVIPLDVKAGDMVLFGKYSGTEIRLEGEDYLIVREDEVLGIFEKSPRKAEAKVEVKAKVKVEVKAKVKPKTKAKVKPKAKSRA